MTKHFLLLAALILSMQVIAQTGIGTTTPHASAKLEVASDRQGFLPPQVTLTSTTDNTTIRNAAGTAITPAVGLLVYNLGSVGLQAGYYYWNGSNWATIATASSPDQAVDYVSVSTISQSAIGDNRDLIFTSNNGGNIPYNTSTGVFTLSANKTYLFQAQIRTNSPSADGSYIEYGFVDAASNTLLVNGTQTITSSTTRTSGFGSNPVINFIYTPTSNQTVKLRTTATTVGTQNITSGTANITQIGSSAIINPWILSGTNTFNTTGNVGIGTATPSSRLNIVGGGVRIASGMGNSSTRPSVNTGTIGNYEIRGVGGGASQNDGQDDGFLRLSAGGGTNAIQQSSIDLSGYSATVPDMNSNIVMRTSGAERLRIDASGNVNITGKLDVGDPTGNVVIKAAGFVGRGTDITLGNLKVRFAASGNMSLQVSSSSGTISTIGSDQYITNGSGSTTILRSVTASPIYLWPSGINFVDMGNSETCILIDTNTKMSWRIIGIVGPGYLNNFISIERLF